MSDNIDLSVKIDSMDKTNLNEKRFECDKVYWYYEWKNWFEWVNWLKNIKVTNLFERKNESDQIDVNNGVAFIVLIEKFSNFLNFIKRYLLL